MTDEGQIDGETHYEKDSNGDIVHKPDVVSTGEVNGTIRQRSGESVQSAIDRASAGDKIILRPGLFEEAVTISTADLTLEGQGRGTVIDGGTTGSAISISSDGVTVRDVAVRTSPGAGNNYDGILVNGSSNITNIWVEASDRHGIVTFAGNNSRIIDIFCDSANIDNSNDVELNSDNSIVDGVIGTVVDAGTGNAVGETA